MTIYQTEVHWFPGGVGISRDLRSLIVRCEVSDRAWAVPSFLTSRLGGVAMPALTISPVPGQALRVPDIQVWGAPSNAPPIADPDEVDTLQVDSLLLASPAHLIRMYHFKKTLWERAALPSALRRIRYTYGSEYAGPLEAGW